MTLYSFFNYIGLKIDSRLSRGLKIDLGGLSNVLDSEKIFRRILAKIGESLVLDLCVEGQF